MAGYSAVFFALDTVKAIRNKPFSFDRTSAKGQQSIANHIIGQLSSSGRVAIMSRDLTWVEKESVAENLLIKKAQKHELTVFVKNETKVTQMLKSEGAEIRLYAAKGFNPKARFTILDFQNSGTRVMIGAPSGDRHIIKHYGKDDFEVVDLANDFIALLEIKSKRI